MLMNLSSYIRFPLIIGALYVLVIANSKESGFKEKFFDYIEDTAVSEDITLRVIEPSDTTYTDEKDTPLTYQYGDWNDHIISSEYKEYEVRDKHLKLIESNEVRINSYGSFNLDILYAKSMFSKKQFRQFEEDKPISLVIKDGFRPKQELQVHIEGAIGDRLLVYIDHDSRKKDNHYMVKYKAVKDSELLQELNVGEIDINFKGSKYAVYDNSKNRGMGIDFTLKKKNFTFKGFGSVTTGKAEIEVFKGNSCPGNIKLSEYQFIRGIYYQIEPLLRYNNTLNPPYPAGYALQAVNINPNGFELWMDDQDPYNNTSATQLSLDGGFYIKMQSGSDYSINFSTGCITIRKAIPQKARIFAVYNLAGTSSTDPYAIHPGDSRHPGGSFAGKIFVFIKYGFSITGSPVPGQDHSRQDIYEVRSFYNLGDRNILPNNFNLLFYMENGLMTTSDIASLGKYTVDYSSGIIQFYYREPFKQLLLANNTASTIYSENQPRNVYDLSRYRIKADYFREARSFQLAHMNIIPGSVAVKVNSRVLPENLYTVDITAGHLVFNNPTDPLIGPDTIIEIRYEYLPLMSQSQEFVGGFRSEYAFSRDLKLGGSLLYSRSTGDEKIPTIGATPSQTVFLEGDATLHLDGSRIAQFINLFKKDKIQSIPLEINGYAEYARSYKNVNTFGKALIDNMEANEDIVTVSLNERDWQYASPPTGCTRGSNRGILNYYYYRDLNSAGTLKGIEYAGAAAKIDYSIKSGPFNVAVGHLPNPIISLASQVSLVLDFADNPASGLGDWVAIAARNLSKDLVDLSGIEYVEFSYLYEGTADADLHIDIGQINEDADGSGMYETEDLNRNNAIDTDPATGISEDMGYAFNEAGHPGTRIGGGICVNHLTRGDGMLNSEDLNANGIIDTLENVFSFQGQSIRLSTSNSGWQVARMFIDRSTITQADLNALKEVQTVRLYIRKPNGARGRVYIDSMKFISSKWRDPRLDQNPANPGQIKVMTINNQDDNEYRMESFSIMMKDLYKSLYAIEKEEDLLKAKESALKIEYAIPAGNSSVSISRRFAKPIDIRDYKTLSAWLNVRSFRAGDKIGVVLGSSDTDYMEYQMNMDYPHVWWEMKLRLKSSSGGYVLPCSISGMPDLKRIIYIKIKIYSSAPPSGGLLWVNDIYLSEPVTQQDSAYWYEGEIKITRPLFRTKKGVPVFSDINIKYIQKGHGAKFSTIGKKDQDMSEANKQVFSSVNILPNWSASLDFVREESRTDSLNEDVEEARRGKTVNDNLIFATKYASDINGVPSFKISYKHNKYENKRDEQTALTSMKRKKTLSNHTPVVFYQQTVDKFLWGKLSHDLLLNMYFKKEDITRAAYGSDMQYLSSLSSPYETEKRQRSDLKYNLDYTHKVFFLRPSFQMNSEEIVTSFGKSQANNTDLLYLVNGDFHFPFVYNKNCRFVERNKLFSASAGINNYGYIAPAIKIDIQYFDNRFKDYDIINNPQFGYRRAKDAQSLVTTHIDIPIFFNKVKELQFVRNFAILYNRSLFFTEANVPFEGENNDPYDEHYGITRSISKLINAGANVFQYYPFYFFLGRKNYGNGRDYVFRNFNIPVKYVNNSVVTEYNNTMRLLENFTVNFSLDFNKVIITSNAGLNQVCERQNVAGTPVQIMTPNFDISLNFDLMKLFKTGFFRPNRDGIPFHSAFLTVGYKFKSMMFITFNYDENVHTPELGFSIKRDRMGITVKGGIDFKQKLSNAYISLNPLKRSFKDQTYFDNMAQYVYYRDRQTGYALSLLFETDVKWLYNFFLLFYRLTSFPIFSLEYTMKMNRYDFLSLVKPEPYDMHLFTARLTLDIHKHVQGGLNARFAIEQYRNRYNSNVAREILAYEVGLNIVLRF